MTYSSTTVTQDGAVIVIAFFQLDAAKVSHLLLTRKKGIIGLDALDLLLELGGNSGLWNSPEDFRNLVALFLQNFNRTNVCFENSLCPQPFSEDVKAPRSSLTG